MGVKTKKLDPNSNYLLTFKNDAAKADFVRRNELSGDDITPVEHTDAYTLKDEPDSLKVPRGTSLYKNLPYKPQLTPNDPIYPQWYTDKISAPAVWDITTGSSSVIVAVIDTGYALSHQDLTGRWAENSGEMGGGKETNGVDDDSDGYVDNWRGWDFAQEDNSPSVGSTDPNGDFVTHGTVVAGLIGATGNNGVGIASLNWATKILPIQALNDDGIGYTSEIAAGIRYAAEKGAKVISLSLGSSEPDDYMRAQINYAISQGAVVIAAAGNSGCNCMVYPANYPEVVAVGSTDSSDNRAAFSSYGANLDVMAPGTGTIRTTYWSSGNTTSSYTNSASGTSIATPIVASLAAIIRTVHPSATAAQTISYITSGADKVAGMGGSTRTDLFGYGRINALTSIKIWRSAYHSQSAYPTILQNNSSLVSLSYKNEGNQAWYDDTSLTSAPTGTKPTHLATSQPINRSSRFGGDWGGDQNRPTGVFSAVYESDGTTLASSQHIASPGQIAKFTFTFSVPAGTTPGTYREYFQPLIEGGTLMNDPGTFLDVTVQTPVWQSSYRSQSTYPSMVAAGDSRTLFLEYTNTGNQTWYDDAGLSSAPTGTKPIHLATSHGINRASQLGQSWGGDRNRPAANFAKVYQANGAEYLSNPHKAEPGESVRFEFNVSTPFGTPPGAYREFFQPIVEGGTTMNDPWTFLDIGVAGAVYASEYVSQCSYPLLTIGGPSQDCWIKYRNVGNVAWYDDTNLASAPSGTSPVRLATSHPVNRPSNLADTSTSWCNNVDRNRVSCGFYTVYQSNGSTEVVGATKVDPGQVAEFRFKLKSGSGSSAGLYREFFQPIAEGYSTMNDPWTFLDAFAN